MYKKVGFSSLLYPLAIILLSAGNIIIGLQPELLKYAEYVCFFVLPYIPPLVVSVIVIIISLCCQIRPWKYWWTIIEAWVAVILSLICMSFHILGFVAAVVIHYAYRIWLFRAEKVDCPTTAHKWLVILVDPMFQFSLSIIIWIIGELTFGAQVGGVSLLS